MCGKLVMFFLIDFKVCSHLVLGTLVLSPVSSY
jgi:hypothetical protein